MPGLQSLATQPDPTESAELVLIACYTSYYIPVFVFFCFIHKRSGSPGTARPTMARYRGGDASAGEFGKGNSRAGWGGVAWVQWAAGALWGCAG